MKKPFSLSHILVIALMLVIPACSMGAPAPTATPTATNMPTLTPTITPSPTATLTPTPTLNFAATQQYESFLPLVQQYYDDGYIPSLEGTYQRLDDFSNHLAKEGFYSGVPAGIQASQFIVRADITMSNYKTEFPRAGCGFMYHSDGLAFFHEILFLSQNGNIYYYYPDSSGRIDYKSNYYEELPNPVKVNLTLIVNKANVYFYVNDKFVLERKSVRKSLPTHWGYATVSGSSLSFGTKCEFTNIEFWKIKQD